MNWQPIETAPKDGRFGASKLLFCLQRGGMSVGWWDADEYAKRPKPMWMTERGLVLGRNWQRDNQPTHWTLPELPEPTP